MIEQEMALSEPNKVVTYWTDALSDEGIITTQKTLFFLAKDILMLKLGKDWASDGAIDFLGETGNLAISYISQYQNIVDEAVFIDDYFEDDRRYTHVIAHSFLEDGEAFMARSELQDESSRCRMPRFLDRPTVQSLAIKMWTGYLSSLNPTHTISPDSISPN